jgi:hypothetical protein
MRIEICAVLALLPMGGAVSVGDPAHRLAGIVELDDGARQAWIVTRAGRERVLRVGDALGEGRITEISRRSVRVQLADRELILQLAGGAVGTGVPADANPAPVVESRPMSAQRLRRILSGERAANDGLSAPAGEEASVAVSAFQGAPGRSGGRTSTRRPPSAADGDDLRRQLNAALGLPSEARIVALGETPIASPAALAEGLAQALERGEVPRLTVEGGAGVDEIYVLPEGVPQGSVD